MRVLIFNVFLVGTCCYAYVRGGAPERLVATFFLIAAGISISLGKRIADLFGSPAYGLLSVDAALLIALTIVAVRANRRWTMTVTAVQLVMIAVHFVRIINPDTIRWVYAVMLAMWSWLMVAVLAIGTYHHHRRMVVNGADPSWSAF